MTETFDAVLAEVRELADRTADYGLQGLTGKARLDSFADRLAAAHAAEVAERDRVLLGLRAKRLTELAEKNTVIEQERDRAEAAERDARTLRELLRQASDYVRIAADEEANLNTHKIPEAHRTTEARFLAEINAAIDACMGEKADA